MSMAPVDPFPADSVPHPRSAQSFRPRPSIEPPSARRAPDVRESAPRPPPVEIAFLVNYGVPVEALHYATSVARRQGVSADAVLIAEGVVSEEVFYRALADHLRVAYLDEDVALAPGVFATASEGYLRLREDRRGLRWLFAPRGTEIFRLMSVARAARGRPLFAVTTRARFSEALRAAYPPELARAASFSAERVDQDLCVRGSLRLGPLAFATAFLAGVIACLLAPVEALSLPAAFFLAGAFLSSVFLRLAACGASFMREETPGWIEDARLPVYTVVIALYKEASVARQLARAIDRFDYPRAKLDVKFVVECDDEATAAALRACPPRAPHEIVVAPEGVPRTKPRALNIAMPLARGSLVAVYDAEDIPDGRQLRRAAALFAAAPENVACLQASLVIDNGGLNWMTELFALEYAALFDVYNKGLAALALPIFLGGTSNHFRLDALREIGFWDAYNVTEDADLGLRLARAGFHVRTFESHTFEEAPAEFRALVKQRTRWFKGWMQTAIAHCRHPARLFADLGARRAVAVLAMFVGGVLGPLLGPLLMGRLAYDAVFGALLAPKTIFETACSALWCFVALSGAAALLWPLLLGMRRRNLPGRRTAFFLLPLWLFMLSVACGRALFELWRNPFHWEKTEHGLTTRGHPEPPSGEEPLLEVEAGA
ncbi:glycosyltransferase [Methylocystis parvus]|uniref:Glycosyltransferase n=1 Tax=Methylocystis parvus TaxID=134 RepID=A0A6B8M8L0_9HYPH|nr:glycosyltransferase [Methylocystis parvus]QGM98222.1 glycosyltransferase [Methylocystis parvus]WBK01450.1 glycosyltransferase [Methylocystis parvus OBBP]